MSALDTDVIPVEILPRLPAKSLARFKCVSKSFKSTILSRNLLVLLGRRSLTCYDLGSPDTATATFVLDCRPLSVVGSFNGLLCILSQYSIVFSNHVLVHVLNPSTRICKHINFPKLGAKVFNFGFGFDHLNLDYKIVVIFDYHENYSKFRITRVYSLNTNSLHKVVTECPTDSMEDNGRGGVLTRNNLLHWLYWSPSLRKRRIGCFDVCEMKWTDDVLLPRYYYDPNHKNYLLEFGIFYECLFSLFENHVDSCFDVWVMKKYGVQDSWVKLFSIPISKDLEGGVVPVACRESSGDILIQLRHSSRLLWYNRTNGKMSEAKFNGSPDLSSLQVYMCNRSTVDIPGGKLFPDSLESWRNIRESLERDLMYM